MAPETPEQRLDRMESEARAEDRRLIAKIADDVSDIKALQLHHKEMMVMTRSDITALYTENKQISNDVTALKARASVLGAVSGVVAGAVSGFLPSIFRGGGG